MSVDRITSQINDDGKIDILRLRHHENVVEAVVIAAVDDLNKAVVDGVALQIGSGDGIDVRSDVENISGRLGDVVHLGGHRRLELDLGELPGLHVVAPTPR